MSYSSPSITASAGTWAQLQARGVRGHIEALIAANSFTAEQARLIRKLLRFDPLELTAILDTFLAGDPVAHSNTKTRILDRTTALKAVLAAAEEIAVLVDAHPGLLKPVALADGTVRTRRDGDGPSYTLTGSATPTNGVGEVYTLTPSGVSSDVIAFDDGGAAGAFSPTSRTFSASASAQTTTYTPSGTGLVTLTAVRDGVIVATKVIDVQAAG